MKNEIALSNGITIYGVKKPRGAKNTYAKVALNGKKTSVTYIEAEDRLAVLDWTKFSPEEVEIIRAVVTAYIKTI